MNNKIPEGIWYNQIYMDTAMCYRANIEIFLAKGESICEISCGIFSSVRESYTNLMKLVGEIYLTSKDSFMNLTIISDPNNELIYKSNIESEISDAS